MFRNQTQHTQHKITLKTIISVYSSPPNSSGKRFARFKDAEIAEIASQELGRNYTAQAVAQARRRMGIAACTPPEARGGARPGAGRPPGKNNKKEYHKHKLVHKLVISDYDAVKYCQSAYERVSDNEYDVIHYTYTRREKWKLRKNILAPGLPRTYTPGLMDVKQFSQAQKFDALARGLTK